MNQNFDPDDDLLPEYDFTKLPVVARGQGRQKNSLNVQIEPDVAKIFPDASAVNEGLRLLIRLLNQSAQQLEKKL